MGLRMERWAARKPFRIAGQSYDYFDVLVVEIARAGHVGRGESLGVDYLGESVGSMTAQLESIWAELEAGISREELQEVLPSGGARCAVDCAMWDLEAKETGVSVFERAGVSAEALATVFTLGVENEVADVRAAAVSDPASQHAALKIKVDAENPVAVIEAIRSVRPDADLVVDANQSWTPEMLREFAPHLGRLSVSMLEQPLPRDGDEALEDFDSNLLICADESCQDSSEIPAIMNRYGAVNIKLDKSGGLTEGLKMVNEARRAGLGLMVGNMCGTSLAMAPAFVIGQYCEFIDLDGPLLNRYDREPAMQYRAGQIHAPSAQLWG